MAIYSQHIPHPAIRPGLQRFTAVHTGGTVLNLGTNAFSRSLEDRRGSHMCNREPLCCIYAWTTQKYGFKLQFRINKEQMKNKRKVYPVKLAKQNETLHKRVASWILYMISAEYIRVFSDLTFILLAFT
jgi:hypothetical protein